VQSRIDNLETKEALDIRVTESR